MSLDSTALFFFGAEETSLVFDLELFNDASHFEGCVRMDALDSSCTLTQWLLTSLADFIILLSSVC